LFTLEKDLGMPSGTVFDARHTFKPFEYPEAADYKHAINQSYWLVSEWNFVSDVQDFHVLLSPAEQGIIRRTLLAISQVEVAVKRFWTSFGQRFPKPEFEQVGVVFGEAEVRHADAYSKLLEVLGMNDDFYTLDRHSVIGHRFAYLSDRLAQASQQTNEEFMLTLTLFAMFIENTSLFSQFLIIKSFNKHRNTLKDIDNVVQATQKEEVVHFLFGAYVIGLVQTQFPEWFGPGFFAQLEKTALEAYEAEMAVVRWIYGGQELEFLPLSVVEEFIRQRINASLQAIGGTAIFSIDEEQAGLVAWFNDELYAEVSTDFFYKRPVTYSKFTQAIQPGDLF
jgi:ribonucleoside-diphosphate reductase beta chain